MSLITSVSHRQRRDVIAEIDGPLDLVDPVTSWNRRGPARSARGGVSMISVSSRTVVVVGVGHGEADVAAEDGDEVDRRGRAAAVHAAAGAGRRDRVAGSDGHRDGLAGVQYDCCRDGGGRQQLSANAFPAPSARSSPSAATRSASVRQAGRRRARTPRLRASKVIWRAFPSLFARSSSSIRVGQPLPGLHAFFGPPALATAKEPMLRQKPGRRQGTRTAGEAKESRPLSGRARLRRRVGVVADLRGRC